MEEHKHWNIYLRCRRSNYHGSQKLPDAIEHRNVTVCSPNKADAFQQAVGFVKKERHWLDIECVEATETVLPMYAR